MNYIVFLESGGMAFVEGVKKVEDCMDYFKFIGDDGSVVGYFVADKIIGYCKGVE